MGLSKNWITEKMIDFEYKKYILLAFLKEVSEHFDANKLYPQLSELIGHYQQVMLLKENTESLSGAFPKQIAKIDLQNFKLNYEQIMQDDSIMKEIESIITYSIPKFEHYLKEGKKIYDFIEDSIHIEPIGIIPLNKEHGYLFFNNNSNKTKVYQYQISIIEQPGENLRGIYTNYVCSYTKGIGNSFENMKQKLLNRKRDIANPATFAIETEFKIPFEESLLPIAKRSLVRYVSSIS